MISGPLGTGIVCPGCGSAGTVASHCETCQSTAFASASSKLGGSRLPPCQWALRVYLGIRWLYCAEFPLGRAFLD